MIPVICDEPQCTADLARSMPCCSWYLCGVHAAAHDARPDMFHLDRRHHRRRALRTGGRRAEDYASR